MKKVKKNRIYLFTLIVFVWVIGGGVYSDISVENLKQEYANEQSKFIEIDGMEVHYRDEGSGMPILLIHGTAASLHTWDDWTSELTKTHRVIRMDLPAFGLTGPNQSRDYSIKSYTSFINNFITEVKIDSFHLAGNSLGGNIAWNYALEHPKKVQKLVLVDASGLPTGKAKPWIFKMANIPVLNTGFLYYTPKFLIQKNIKEVYADDSKITAELLTRYHKMALREGNRQAFVDRAKLDFKQDSLTTIGQLKSLQNPTLIIWGEQDEWIPLACGKAMNENIPNSTLEVLKNSGHVPMEENPKESLELIQSFFKK
jgi:pimeloyl-ACP methyl ester carboxylesterase